MVSKFIIKVHLHHQERIKVILFLFQVGARWLVLVWVGEKSIQRGI